MTFSLKYSVEVCPGKSARAGISKKPRVVDGRTEVREYLSLTVMFDEDVIYGAPAARFAARLADLVQDGYGLIE
ncbi:MAG: 2-oxo acid dehydrogenase subunit E2 [Candidatus Bathyarchaeia archaeon]